MASLCCSHHLVSAAVAGACTKRRRRCPRRRTPSELNRSGPGEGDPPTSSFQFQPLNSMAVHASRGRNSKRQQIRAGSAWRGLPNSRSSDRGLSRGVGGFALVFVESGAQRPGQSRQSNFGRGHWFGDETVAAGTVGFFPR